MAALLLERFRRTRTGSHHRLYVKLYRSKQTTSVEKLSNPEAILPSHKQCEKSR
jgi:hypothetical protein